jgi:hypothetical protein
MTSEEGKGGGGAKSYESEKARASINHSILSGIVDLQRLHP